MNIAIRRTLVLAVAASFFIAIGAGCAGAGDDGQDSSGDPSSIRGGGEAPAAEPNGLAYDDTSGDGAAPVADAQLADLLSRKIVQNTSIDVEVEEVGRNFQDIVRVAEVNEGFIASSSFSSFDGEQTADVTIRIPADRHQAVLQEIRGMGEVITEGSDSSDVTEEYTDLEARLRALDATERRYLELLSEAANVNDVLTVQDRLDVVRGEIERVQGRINLLDDLTDLATITIHLRPADAIGGSGGGGISGAAAAAWEASLDALRFIATAAVVVVAFSWWLLPPLAAAAVAARWVARRPRTLTTPS